MTRIDTKNTAWAGWFLYDDEVEAAVCSVSSGARVSRHGSFAAWLRSFWAVFAILVFAPTLARSAELKPETAQGWEEYLKTIQAKEQERLVFGKSFLASDEIPGQAAKLRSGELIVAPAGPHVPLKIPSGLIHDWTGATFIRDATFSDVFPAVRNYDRYRDFYHPNVVESKRVSATEWKDRFSMVLMNKSVVGKTALDADYESTYVRVDDHRWYSITDATRIQEIADYNTPAQHVLPIDHGTGLIWRLHSIARFEERDGGVYIEVEAIVLSREIPSAMRWVIDPIVRRVSRSSMATSLRQTESAVRESPASIASANPAMR